MNATQPALSMPQKLRALLAVAFTMTVLDLVFLGVVAKDFFDAQLGPLKAAQVNGVAAALFYAMYVYAVVHHAVGGARNPGHAARLGAQMGLFGYATFELTSWSVLAGWPAAMVPVDITWGVVLTAAVAWVGARAAGLKA